MTTPRRPTVTLVQGTWGGPWAHPGTPFRTMLDTHVNTTESFEWSYDVSGLLNLWGRKHTDWVAGGKALTYFLRGLPYEQRNVIAHSHGGQVVAYAAREHDCWIRRIITVSTPVREDMEAVWAGALPNIGHWTHVASKRGDWMIRLGQLFDGRIGWDRQMPLADRNLLIPGMGHTGVFTDPKMFAWWPTTLLPLVAAGNDARTVPHG